MLTYQQWDFIADVYTPALALFSLALLWQASRKTNFKSTFNSVLGLMLSVGFIYLMMFLDNALALWPALGLDYSTHTALALVFVLFIAGQNLGLWVISALSMVLYAGLMIHQAYHTLLDILTTSIVVIPVIWWIQKQRFIRLN